MSGEAAIDGCVLISPGAIICPSCLYVMKAKMVGDAIHAHCAYYECAKKDVEVKVQMARVPATPVHTV